MVFDFQGVMWSFAAACDVINPCMQVAVFLVFPRLICRLCPRFSGHLEKLSLLEGQYFYVKLRNFYHSMLAQVSYKNIV